MPRAAKPAPPFFLAPYDPGFHPSAIQALAEGRATEHQQKEALKWIVEVACATYQTVFIPGDSHATSFFAGRQFSGQTIVKMAKLNPRAFQKARIEASNPHK
jgi:hypothetical protein